MVYRVYVEKKLGFDHEAAALHEELRSFLGLAGLAGVRILNRYDVENIDAALFDDAVENVFSEPMVDDVYRELPAHDGVAFAAEYLPGQFDQRADSAAQCVQLLRQVERPDVRTATVYLLSGSLSEADIEAVKKHVINPVERREASLAPVDTLRTEYAIPTTVETMTGFIDYDPDQLAGFIRRYGLAMDAADIAFCQSYFRGERRDPTLTEIRMIDTYWSDHCRHTTFLTELGEVTFGDADVEAAWRRYLAEREALGRTKPVCLMDIATIGAKALKARGLLNDLDESEEINACTIRMKVDVNGEQQDWLLLFKNETHNHPTEIEPFGGAATCIGGAIRDPLSGRGYVYQAMRVTGAADPTRSLAETIPGKLPQRQLVTTAAAGYSSYGNQIGLATGLVDEIYHDGYAAKRMEIGAVVGAVPADTVRRETPVPGDVVILLGGRTGRDGCGGATGSSKAHTQESLETCGAEVQKGNAPEERKLQRLFRNPEAVRRIKRCNDFGAGGVSVAIGELADGLDIDLNAVPRKYEGLDGTELAISESQERMAVVLAPEDADAFRALADAENLEATTVAVVTAQPRLVMRWNGARIVDISRGFLNSNGAPKHVDVRVDAQDKADAPARTGFAAGMRAVASDLNLCSRRGLCERFDSTNGASSLLMPFGGRRQLTPAQVMASRIPVEGGESATASVMAYGFDPFVSEKSPWRGAYLAVVDSLAKLVAAGSGTENIHLTFQEYFQRMTDPSAWGKPLSALLGALEAQLDFGVAAIGGKDSMSGSFEDIHVPPTLVSFAVGVCPAADIASGEFKRAGSPIGWLRPAYRANGTPDPDSQRALFDRVTGLLRSGAALSAWAVGRGGAAAAAFRMAMGNGFGVAFDGGARGLFDAGYGSFLVEYADDMAADVIGRVTTERAFSLGGERVPADELEALYEGRLNDVFPATVRKAYPVPAAYSREATSRVRPVARIARPRVLIPVFPGTNCEYDTARAFLKAGATPEVLVIRNLTAPAVAESAEAFAEALGRSQIVFIPGGFSGGDEPDGSGKFIAAFLRNPRLRDGIHELLRARDGLIGGICNGFQALIKLGLVPYGEIREARDCVEATLTFNDIGRHQSRLVRTRIASNLSPWLMHTHVGEVYLAPVSHGEGRFIASDEVIARLAGAGQIAAQYCDDTGAPSMDIRFNPNGSCAAVEGITSPDGRVFGKMAHSERVGFNVDLYKNVPGNYDNGMFRGAVDYFG
uniref:Putative phosphoribosylformylglycinamidine synthase n=1 Tax=uncultured bacterium Ad_125_D08 TaxID=1489285 RepID=A0A0B4N0B4_9BACT|nr:putative phosphoribosylformylglycinamidine synthase [uncultured bacterium Ad_125_D08]